MAGSSNAIVVDHLTCSWHASSAAVPKSPALKPAPEAVAVSVASTDSAGHPVTLTDVSFTVPSGSLAVVCGPVGCGKSSLLMALLSELEPQSGSVHVPGRRSYAAQHPYILTGTVRENILCGQAYEADRYADVIAVCCLGPDLSLWPQGDETVIGERGVNLSGGQRARVCLARAVYMRADVYLLDDPLSAVDAKVGRALFEWCINGFLKGSTRVLVTHQLQHLTGADSIIVLSHGRVAMQGSFADVSAAFAAATTASTGDRASSSAVSDGSDSAAASAPNLSDLGDAVREMMEEFNRSGEAGGSSISDSDEDSATGDDSADPRLADTPLPSAADGGSSESSSTLVGAPSPTGDSTPVLPTQVRPVAQPPFDTAPVPASAAPKTPQEQPPSSSIIVVEKINTGSVGASAYVRYWSATGSRMMSVYILLLLSGGATLFTMTSVYLAKWSGLPPALQQDAFYPSLYGGLVAASVVVSWLRATLFFLAAVEASRRLHDAAFARVLRAPLSFFDSNPAGRILNRFSRDVGLMDDIFPWTAFDFANSLFAVFAVLALVASVVPWVLLAIAPLAVMFYFLRRHYLLTARVVKRLESVSRSPVYSILTECLGGLPVIRAFDMGPELIRRFRVAQDKNIQCYYVFLATSRWLGIRLDGLCIALLIGESVPPNGLDECSCNLEQVVTGISEYRLILSFRLHPTPCSRRLCLRGHPRQRRAVSSRLVSQLHHEPDRRFPVDSAPVGRGGKPDGQRGASTGVY